MRDKSIYSREANHRELANFCVHPLMKCDMANCFFFSYFYLDDLSYVFGIRMGLVISVFYFCCVCLGALCVCVCVCMCVCGVRVCVCVSKVQMVMFM